MSFWTHIQGTLLVSPMGRTQHEATYILNTVLDHLPIVSGSEGDMDVYISKCRHMNSSSSRDEFGQQTNNLRNRYGQRSQRDGWLDMTSHYLLTVHGDLRDRMFQETFREFMKWICRLSKRVMVLKVLVSIDGYDEKSYIPKHYVLDGTDVFAEMEELPSWCTGNTTGEPAWCEYLMWDRAKDSEMPILLKYKYFKDEENDREAERRINYY